MEAGNKTWVFVMAGEMAGNIWNCENIGVLHRNGWDFFGNGWEMAEILGFSKEMAEKWEMMKFFGDSTEEWVRHGWKWLKYWNFEEKWLKKSGNCWKYWSFEEKWVKKLEMVKILECYEEMAKKCLEIAKILEFWREMAEK